MLKRLQNYMQDLSSRQRIAVGLAKGANARQLRAIDLTNPQTWEFSGLSQNGEDGIIEVLRGQLLAPAGTFLEIGCADGVQNNTAWLALVARLQGVMVEGDPSLAAAMARVLPEFCIGNRYLQQFVSRENAPGLLELLPERGLDVFSLDIDGVDLHIARALLDGGMRPKIVVVEFNSVFGPDRSVTVPYQPDFSFHCHPTRLYYGASLGAWKSLLEPRGLQFLTVEQCGVNAFFVDPTQFQPDFIASVRGLAYAENRYQRIAHGVGGEAQFALIADQTLETV